jgi:hypothetical protein
MPLMLSGSYEIAPSGTHRAVCIGVADLGTHSDLSGNPVRRVALTFELSDKKDAGGNPLQVTRIYAARLTPKAALGKDIRSWLSPTPAELDKFDLFSVIGKGAFVVIEHVQKGEGAFSNVATVLALPEDYPVKPPQTASWAYVIGSDEKDFDKLPMKLQEKIAASREKSGHVPQPVIQRPMPATAAKSDAGFDDYDPKASEEQVDRLLSECEARGVDYAKVSSWAVKKYDLLDITAITSSQIDAVTAEIMKRPIKEAEKIHE